MGDELAARRSTAPLKHASLLVRGLVFLLVCSAPSLLAGCKRKKPAPFATRLWFGPSGGCVETKPDPTVGTLGCWGTNDQGQIGDGTTAPRDFTTGMTFKEGTLTDLALGAGHSCGVFDHTRAYCWGAGVRGQLGKDIHRSLVPVPTGDESTTFVNEPVKPRGDTSAPKGSLAVRVGDTHSCVRSGRWDRLHCFGANDEGQLGLRLPDGKVDDWSLNANGDGGDGQEIRAFALGIAHTCVAYSKSAHHGEVVQCRGRAASAPSEKLLSGVVVTALTAGAHHTCAQLEDRTVRCWGKNDAGQLGDGTTNDAKTPVAVLDLRVDGIAAGARHTCARLLNGTVACWGDNTHHQLASGTTERSTRPVVIVGVLGVQQIAAGGDATCARLGDGYVRCWGENSGQLGEGSTVEHTVPMPIRYR